MAGGLIMVERVTVSTLSSMFEASLSEHGGLGVSQSCGCCCCGGGFGG